MYTGILAQSTGQIGFAATTGAGNQQILAAIDPIALRQACDLRCGDVAPVLIVDVGNAGRELEARLTDQSFLLALFTDQGFLFDQQRESLGKGQAFIGADLFQLALQGVCHAAKLELPQRSQGLCGHAMFSVG